MNHGNKFIPSFFLNKSDFLNFLLEDLDNNLLHFNNFYSFFIKDKENTVTEDFVNLASEQENLIDTNICDDNISFFYSLLKKKKNKFSKLKLDLAPGVIDFRNKIHTSILQNSNEFKANSNLTLEQLYFLKKFKTDKPFTILSCDKNVGTAIIGTKKYLDLTFNFIAEDSSYTALNYNPLALTIKKINLKLDKLFINFHISKKFRDIFSLKIEDCVLGNFKLLAKLHKAKLGWRPIINSINHPTSKICFFIDTLLKPFVINTPSYIKDSQHLIQICNPIRFVKKPFIYSLDFSSLYSSINPDHAIPLLTEFISSHWIAKDIDLFAFQELMKLIFNYNIFKFKNKFFVQNKGLAMGCICGPTFANLYLHILENKWMTIHKPLVYARFIDDVTIISSEELDFDTFQESFVYLKLTMETGDEVNFLDLIISYNPILKNLHFNLYIKPTNNGCYLLPSSEHPDHIFSNIPKNLLMRIRRICSDYIDFIHHTKILFKQLVLRGYPKNKLLTTFSYISKIDRETLIPYKEKKENAFFNKNTLCLPRTFISGFKPLDNFIYDSFNKTINSDKTLTLRIINKVNKNLNSLLVNNFPFSGLFKVGTFSCNKCLICGLLHLGDSICMIDSGINLKLKSKGTCKTTHLVYIIICTKCDKFYVGETEKTLETRIKQHLNHIRKFKPFYKYHDKIVARHFNLRGHTLFNFKCCIFKADLVDTLIRKNIERDLIRFLNIGSVKCINLNVPLNTGFLAFGV